LAEPYCLVVRKYNYTWCLGLCSINSVLELIYYTPLVGAGTSSWGWSFRGSQHVEVYYVTRLINIYGDVFWGKLPFFLSLSSSTYSCRCRGLFLYLITRSDTHTHTHTHIFGRTPLDEGSALSWGLWTFIIIVLFHLMKLELGVYFSSYAAQIIVCNGVIHSMTDHILYIKMNGIFLRNGLLYKRNFPLYKMWVRFIMSWYLNC